METLKKYYKTTSNSDIIHTFCFISRAFHRLEGDVVFNRLVSLNLLSRCQQHVSYKIQGKWQTAFLSNVFYIFLLLLFSLV